MRNETTLNALASELQRNCGDTLAAAKAVGVSLIFVNQWRKDDKQVDEQLTEAERVGTQGLVSAAIQRAVHGVPKGIYYRGLHVTDEMQYSDSLLNTLLAAKLPEFKKGAEGGAGVQVNVNVANLMPRADNYQQWLEMKQQTLAKPVEALPPPSEEAIAAAWIMARPDAIDAEYEEILPVPAFAGIDL